MQGSILLGDGTVTDATPSAVERSLGAGRFFWLDVTSLGDDGRRTLLEDFKLHPLVVEDAEHFGQRPKLDEYDGFFHMVVHGAEPDRTDTVEVHFFYAEHFLVTVRRGPCHAIDDVRTRLAQHHDDPRRTPIMLLYRLVDGLVDSFFPVLGRFDDRIDELEDAILERPTEEQLGDLFTMKRHLVALRKVISPERDMFAGLLAGVDELPGMDADAERYFRDIYDHLVRTSDLVDSYRDLLSGAMDTHLSTVSNRLNVVMKQLTIIATVFLPLSFLTGFFGQNFSWLVNRIGSLGAFLGLAVGLEVLAAAVLLVFFRRRGWLQR